MNMLVLLATSMLLTTTPSDKQDNHWLIVPGTSIGMVHLGTNVDTVFARIGRPNPKDEKEGDAAMGHFWFVWRGKRGSELDIYDVRGERDSAAHPENFIRQVRITSAAFHTNTGIHVGSTIAAVRRIDPNLSSAKESSQIRLYDDVKSGIAYEFRPVSSSNTTWRCAAIVIHRKQISVLQEYSRFRDYS
jgi:hypothetical protein